MPGSNFVLPRNTPYGVDVRSTGSIMTPRLTRDALRQPPWSCALAVIVPVTAMLMLEAAGVFVDRLPSAPLLAAVLAVAWYCGRLPALLATIVSIGLHAYVLIRSPRHETDVADVVGLILFAGLAVFVSYAAPRLGQTLRELEHERKREQIARTEAERHGREADELRRLSRALTHTASPTAAAQRVADAVKRFFDPSSAVVRLLEPDGAMVAVAIAGENPRGDPRSSDAGGVRRRGAGRDAAQSGYDELGPFGSAHRSAFPSQGSAREARSPARHRRAAHRRRRRHRNARAERHDDANLCGDRARPLPGPGQPRCRWDPKRPALSAGTDGAPGGGGKQPNEG